MIRDYLSLFPWLIESRALYRIFDRYLLLSLKYLISHTVTHALIGWKRETIRLMSKHARNLRHLRSAESAEKSFESSARISPFTSFVPLVFSCILYYWMRRVEAVLIRDTNLKTPCLPTFLTSRCTKSVTAILLLQGLLSDLFSFFLFRFLLQKNHHAETYTEVSAVCLLTFVFERVIIIMKLSWGGVHGLVESVTSWTDQFRSVQNISQFLSLSPQ